MLCRTADNRADVDGHGHTLHNNVAYKARTDVARLDTGKCDVANNSFTLGLALRDGDFVNLDEAELFRPRKANGDLPDVGLLHPAEGSQLIDKGVDSGFKFRGNAPDLGAFER
jgi:pectate lyase